MDREETGPEEPSNGAFANGDDAMTTGEPKDLQAPHLVGNRPTIIRMTVPSKQQPVAGAQPDNEVMKTGADLNIADGQPMQLDGQATVDQGPPAVRAGHNNTAEAMQDPSQGKSLPVSPTFPLSPSNMPQQSSSGPATPNPMVSSPAVSAQTVASSATTATNTSTTSFLANQHQKHNPQNINTAAMYANPQQPQPQYPQAAHVLHQQPLQGQPPAQPINHRMALNDAFSYLDKVKSEFANQPEVYNRFLQVMREFKANAIDANGVIIRVVQLFRGHRDLILGFNAFLPRTHHIDPSIAESGELPAGFVAMHGGAGAAAGPSSMYPNIVQRPANAPAGWNQSAQQPPLGRPPVINPALQAPQQAAYPQPTQTTAAGPGGAIRRSSNAQFTRAIAYVKKVKQRFANDPESYKLFLSALHSFHKDQKTVTDVVVQIQSLFKTHPDLMEEFTQFLPDSGNGTDPMGRGIGLPFNRLPPMGQFSPEMDRRGEPTIAPAQSQPAQLQATGPQQPAPAVPPSKVSRSKRTRPFPSLPSRSGTQKQAGVTKTAEEVDFFERVKSHLGNRQVYAEFLKCLNMYSQNILKLSELIQLISGFIGGNEELFSWFKRYIGYTGQDDTFKLSGMSQDASSQGTTYIHGPHDFPEINLNSCKRVGSYRLLPSTHKLAPSSGRSDLCREVLNDQMISCPTFESEDSTFIASKKNMYEEALFRCEDERFELDLLIEGNRATIAVLEPIMKTLSQSSDNHQSSNLILDHKLNGSSAMVYKRNIRRIYGEKGDEIFEALQKNPVVSIPIVLKRLKQKDEEWQRARRDWQKVWREVHFKNYYRSLDHQSIEFKQTDRRTASVKQLIQDLDVLAEERRKSNGNNRLPLLTLDCVAKDNLVIYDAYRLVLKAIKNSGSIASGDRKSTKEFLAKILPLFYSHALKPNRNHKPLSQLSDNSDSEYSETEMDDEKKLSQVASVYFINSSIYGILKMFSTVVNRLAKLKTLAEESNNKPYSSERQNVVAQFLNLAVDDVESDSEFGDGGPEKVRSHEIPSDKDMYGSLVTMLKKLLSGDMDPQVFEERARFMFGLEAYSVFTVDRLIHSIIRQCHSLLPSVSDSNKGDQLLSLLADSHRMPEYTCRMSAEAIISSDPKDRLIRVQAVKEPVRSLHVNLVDSATSPVDYGTPEERWSAYVDAFVRLDVNPMYADEQGHGVFLSRTRNASTSSSVVLYNLECKICVNTYKLHYVENTEDFVFNPKPKSGIHNDIGKHFNHWLAQFKWHEG